MSVLKSKRACSRTEPPFPISNHRGGNQRARGSVNHDQVRGSTGVGEAAGDLGSVCVGLGFSLIKANLTCALLPACSAVAFFGLRVDEERIACAFRVAEDPRIRRAPPAVEDAMTAAEAYADPALVCGVWAIVEPHATGMGYAPYGGVRCDTGARSGGL